LEVRCTMGNRTPAVWWSDMKETPNWKEKERKKRGWLPLELNHDWSAPGTEVDAWGVRGGECVDARDRAPDTVAMLYAMLWCVEVGQLWDRGGRMRGPMVSSGTEVDA